MTDYHKLKDPNGATIRLHRESASTPQSILVEQSSRSYADMPLGLAVTLPVPGSCPPSDSGNNDTLPLSLESDGLNLDDASWKRLKYKVSNTQRIRPPYRSSGASGCHDSHQEWQDFDDSNNNDENDDKSPIMLRPSDQDQENECAREGSGLVLSITPSDLLDWYDLCDEEDEDEDEEENDNWQEENGSKPICYGEDC